MASRRTELNHLEGECPTLLNPRNYACRYYHRQLSIALRIGLTLSGADGTGPAARHAPHPAGGAAATMLQSLVC